jgi:hypothetical protein
LGVDSSRRGRGLGKDVGGRTWCKYCVHMYVNGKLRSVETMPGVGGGRIKENNWGDDFKYDIFDQL